MEQLADTKLKNTATKQAVKGRDNRGRFTVGNVPKTGFHTNPECRSNGPWKKERTPRGKLEKILEEMTIGEFFEQIAKNNIAFLDEKVGDVAVSERLRNVFKITKDSRLKIVSSEFDSLMKFVYGNKVEQSYQITEEASGNILKGFVIPAVDPEDIEKLERNTHS